jgi:RNA polymerase sigma-70 factor (family 1)
MTEPKDISALVEKIAYQDDESSYRQFFLFFYKDLHGFAHSLLRSQESAEEVVLDVLMRVWTNRSRLPEVRNLKVYLFTAIKNTALNYLAQHHKYTSWDLENISVEQDLDLYTPEEIFLKEELKEKIALTIRSLPPKCQMVYKLIREEGLTYKEVAAIMGIAENTVDRHLNIAFQKLTALVREYLYSDR